MPHKLDFIGFGGVGRGLADILLERGDWLKDTFGSDFLVVSVSPVKSHNSGTAACIL